MVIASIDLMKGNAVQLIQGREKKIERNNPLELANKFSKYGEIAVIDLDAAINKGDNQPLIKKICSLPDCRVGGGIRLTETAKKFISWGARKVIVGTKVFENDKINVSFLKKLSQSIGKNRVIIAVDSHGGEIVTHGWRHRTGIPLFHAARKLESFTSEFLITFVEKEGKMEGTDMEAVNILRKITQLPLTIAGGISSLAEIKQFAAQRIDVQLGMALYTGKIKLHDAFLASLNWQRKLLPVITIDECGQVLMLAYCNQESLKRTFLTEKMWYFSRSRKKLWKKGETSGNIQKLVRIRSDCDRDALLATVKQTGNACHMDHYSCFGDKIFSLYELYQIIKKRFEKSISGSYTMTLTDEKLRDKLLEETKELVEAKTKDDVIWEAADLMYFLTVLIQKKGVTIDDVLRELRRRRREGEQK